jgi:hypothetical protein
LENLQHFPEIHLQQIIAEEVLVYRIITIELDRKKKSIIGQSKIKKDTLLGVFRTFYNWFPKREYKRVVTGIYLAVHLALYSAKRNQHKDILKKKDLEKSKTLAICSC